MEDPRLRAEFHRAFDALVPPAPWLAVSLRERFRERRPDARTRPVIRTAWLAPAVAVLLAVAIVAALLYVARSIPQRTIPVHPPRVGQGVLGCPQWSRGSSGGYGYGQDSGWMTSATTGWYGGALRTTDGGAHWRDVSPPAMRADSPSDAGPRPYPPSYAEFFLDSNHAWVARSYSSASSCFDHVTVFSTSDGGRTWEESAPIAAAIQLDTYLQQQITFLDPQHGWLMVMAGGRIAPDSFVYSTTDGGRYWKLVAPLSVISSFCNVRFVSQTTGYVGGCAGSASPTATLTMTRDGGKTWNNVRLPEPFGTTFGVVSPAFFDQSHGVVWVNTSMTAGNTFNQSGYLVATGDGGRTWQLLGDTPPGYAMAFEFMDANNFWVLINDQKGGSPALYKTSDGGKSWMLVTNDTLIPYSAKLTFIDQKTGFIFQTGQLGEAPKALLVTSDGGRTWKDIHPQIS